MESSILREKFGYTLHRGQISWGPDALSKRGHVKLGYRATRRAKSVADSLAELVDFRIQTPQVLL